MKKEEEKGLPTAGEAKKSSRQFAQGNESRQLTTGPQSRGGCTAGQREKLVDL